MSQNNSWLKRNGIGAPNLRHPNNYQNDSHAVPTDADRSFKMPPPRKSSIMYMPHMMMQVPRERDNHNAGRSQLPRKSSVLKPPQKYDGRPSFGPKRQSLAPPRSREPQRPRPPPLMNVQLPSTSATPIYMSTPHDHVRSILNSGRRNTVKCSASKKVNFNDVEIDGVQPLQESVIQENPAPAIAIPEKVSIGTNTDTPFVQEATVAVTQVDANNLADMIKTMGMVCSQMQNFLSRFENLPDNRVVALMDRQPSKLTFVNVLEDIVENSENSRSLSVRDTPSESLASTSNIDDTLNYKKRASTSFSKSPVVKKDNVESTTTAESPAKVSSPRVSVTTRRSSLKSPSVKVAESFLLAKRSPSATTSAKSPKSNPENVKSPRENKENLEITIMPSSPLSKRTILEPTAKYNIKSMEPAEPVSSSKMNIVRRSARLQASVSPMLKSPISRKRLLR